MRETKKRKLYSKIENIGNVGMIAGLVGFGASLALVNPLLYGASCAVAVTGTSLSLVGEKLKGKEDMALGNYEINNKTKKLCLKK